MYKPTEEEIKIYSKVRRAFCEESAEIRLKDYLEQDELDENIAEAIIAEADFEQMADDYEEKIWDYDRNDEIWDEICEQIVEDYCFENDIDR